MLECRFILRGQGSVLHSCSSLASPSQSAPPWAGCGLVQVLVLVWLPPPQSAEHSDQLPYSLHPPSRAEGLFWMCRYVKLFMRTTNIMKSIKRLKLLSDFSLWDRLCRNAAQYILHRNEWLPSFSFSFFFAFFKIKHSFAFFIIGKYTSKLSVSWVVVLVLEETTVPHIFVQA